MSDTDLTPTTAVPAEGPNLLPLVFEEPRGRGKPPRHLADLTPSSARERPGRPACPAYRARQLSAPLLRPAGRDPDQMTDLPAAERDASSSPRLLPAAAGAGPTAPQRRPGRDREERCGSLLDGALVECVLMRYSRPRDACACPRRPAAGAGLPVLRDRAAAA